MCRYHNVRWYAVQETAALAANATKRDWTMSINTGAIGIVADIPETYYRNLEVCILLSIVGGYVFNRCIAPSLWLPSCADCST